MMKDAEFLRLFETAQLPRGNWTHQAHIKVAYLYLRNHALPQALEKARLGIQAYNKAHGVPEGPTAGYHETTTAAWVRLVYLALCNYGPASTADTFYEAHPELSQKNVLRFFYSRAQFLSPEAKTAFVEPDLTPLPRSPLHQLVLAANPRSPGTGFCLLLEPENPLGAAALHLIRELSAELAGRYPELKDGGTGAFTPADALVSRSAFIVARLNNQPVGCGALRPLDDQTVEVKRMYVAEAARRKGVAGRILAVLENQAWQFGYDTIRLETGHRQPEAVALYESCGYRKIPAFGKYIGNPVSICFEKPIQQPA